MTRSISKQVDTFQIVHRLTYVTIVARRMRRAVAESIDACLDCVDRGPKKRPPARLPNVHPGQQHAIKVPIVQ